MDTAGQLVVFGRGFWTPRPLLPSRPILTNEFMAEGEASAEAGVGATAAGDVGEADRALACRTRPHVV